MNPLLKSRLVAGIVIVLVFLAGVAVGVCAHHTLLRRAWPGFGLAGWPSRPGPRPEMKNWMHARLDRSLSLTPEQHARIDTVLTRREADLRALMSETRPRFEAIANRTRGDIQAVLTPEQQEKFAEITRRMDARRKGPAGHPGTGP
jgi:Spy/CpxP family protein refolding chaperone